MNEHENTSAVHTMEDMSGYEKSVAVLRRQMPHGTLQNACEARPHYTVSDDGTVTRWPMEMPDDFADYLRATDDWGFGHPGEDRPGYDEWKKSQDPDWEPEDNTVQLPEEVMEALRAAAEEAGKEPPYSVDIYREDNPELFDKLEEAFGKVVLIEPEEGAQLPEGFKLPEGFQFPDVDPSAAPYIYPDVSDNFGKDPESVLPHRQIDPRMLPDRADTPDVTLPYIVERAPQITPLEREDNSEFFKALEGKLEGVDLDEAFKDIIQERSGLDLTDLQDAVTDGPDPEIEPEPEPIACTLEDMHGGPVLDLPEEQEEIACTLEDMHGGSEPELY